MFCREGLSHSWPGPQTAPKYIILGDLAAKPAGLATVLTPLILLVATGATREGMFASQQENQSVSTTLAKEEPSLVAK